MYQAVREFAIASITIVVLALAAFPLSRLVPFQPNRIHLWHVIPIGLIQAILCLFAFWLGWGGSRLLFRLFVVAIGAYLFYLGMSTTPGIRIVPIAIITLGTSMIVTLPRLAGLRLCRLAVDGVPESTAARGQFSLIDLFLWTLAAALLAGTARLVDLSDQLRFHNLVVNLFTSARLTICTLAAMWAMLTLHRRVRMRAAIAIGIVVAIETAIYYGPIGPFGSNWIAAVAYPVTASALCLAFFILRCRGFRIERNRSIRFVTLGQPSDVPTTDSLPAD